MDGFFIYKIVSASMTWTFGSIFLAQAADLTQPEVLVPGLGALGAAAYIFIRTVRQDNSYIGLVNTLQAAMKQQSEQHNEEQAQWVAERETFLERIRVLQVEVNGLRLENAASSAEIRLLGGLLSQGGIVVPPRRLITAVVSEEEEPEEEPEVP